MAEIIFSSKLRIGYREDLEALIYFNPQQGKIRNGIIESIEKYGSPRLVVSKDSLHIAVGEFQDAQTLFTFKSGNLIGLIIHVRVDEESILVLHVAVAHDYSTIGSHSEEMLVLRMICELRKIAKRIRGVNFIRLMYDQGGARRIPV